MKETKGPLKKYDFAKASPVRVCFTGKNRAGSWEMRGAQISACRSNWVGTQEIGKREIDAFDVFCFVKKPVPELMREIGERGKLVVFDIIDSWAQPAEGLTHVTVEKTRELFKDKWSNLFAHAYIFPNFAMMADLRSLTSCSTFIYHHYRPEYDETRPIRRKASIVGYEGNANYLGEWLPVIENICRKKGMEFQVNPEDLRDIDIGFAGRGGEHDSFMANRYKSNVKLANFYGAGIPCIVNAKERSYHETDNGSVAFFETEAQLEDQIERLRDFELRSSIHERFLKSREPFHVKRLSDEYEMFFQKALKALRDGVLPGAVSRH